MNTKAKLHLMQKQAALVMIEFPQYSINHFTLNYTMLVVLRKDVVTKMGLHFKKGEMAMATGMVQSGQRRFRTLWSFRHKCGCSVQSTDLIVCQGQSEASA